MVPFSFLVPGLTDPKKPSKIRPHWGPTQVRSIRDLKIGETYKIIDHQTNREEKIIIREIFQKENRRWWIKITNWPNVEPVKEESCADLGITSYWSRTWGTAYSLHRI